MSYGYLTRPAITAAQLSQAQELLTALVPNNPFYTRKLKEAGVDQPVGSLEEYSRRIPFTTKGELAADQAEHPPYGSNLTYPLEHYSRCHQTSGTSGTPLRWLDTPESWDWMTKNWVEVYRAAGVQGHDRVFFAFSFGPFIGFWLAFEAAARIGCLCLPGGGLNSSARLQSIFTHRTNILCCTPTYAIRLAEVAAEEGYDLKKSPVKTLIVAGEPGGSIPATRTQLEQLWPGVRVFDHHGMTEIGAVTHECPTRPGVLHVIEPAYLAEVIDPETGHAVGPGQTGELVLTNLGRTGSPLLRYRTGDLVKAGDVSAGPCPCGRYTMTLEGGILGRADDMVVVRGVNLYPSAVEEVVRNCGGVAEYQVKIDSRQALKQISVQIEPAADVSDTEDLVKRLERAFQTAFSLRVPVTPVSRGVLPRFELKARRWNLNE